MLVGAGGFIGANARYWLGGWIQSRSGSLFPWETLAINVSGSFLIGLFMFLALRENWEPGWRLFIAIGVLGGYTTFSSFSYETIRLLASGSYLEAFGYIFGSAGLSVAGAWSGMAVARSVVGA